MILKMYGLGLIGIMILSAYQVSAQSNNIEIRLADSDKLLINQVAVGSETNVEDLTEVLGEYDRIIDYPSGEQSYFYEDAGFMYSVKDGKLIGIGINFNWDGDTKFPEQSYTGQLKIGESEITRDTKIEEIEALKSTEFMCPIRSMCLTKDKDARIRGTLAFEDERISQFLFLIR